MFLWGVLQTKVKVKSDLCLKLHTVSTNNNFTHQQQQPASQSPLLSIYNKRMCVYFIRIISLFIYILYIICLFMTEKRFILCAKLKMSLF